MRSSALLLAVAVVAAGACDDDGGPDSISKSEWIEEADAICAENDDEIAALDEPDFDATGDLTDEQLEQAADFLEDQDELQQDTIDQLEELPPPEEAADADEVDEILGVVQEALDDEGRAIDAAQDGDAEEFQELVESAADKYQEAQEGAADFGLKECGQPDEDEPIEDDDTGLDDNTGLDDENTGTGDATPDVSPTTLLGSFTGSFETEFLFETTGSITLLADATYVDGDQDCVVRGEVGGLTFEERVVLVGDEAYIEEDGEARTRGRDDPEVADALENCPSDPGFWSDFSQADLEDGRPAELDGVAAERFDLRNDAEALESGGFPEGVDVETYDVWVAVDGGYLLGVDVRLSSPARVCRDLFPDGTGPGEPCTIRLRVRIADADDPSLTVELPAT